MTSKVLGCDNTRDEEDDAGLVSKDEEKASELEPKSTSTGIADKDMKKKDESSVTTDTEVAVDVADSSNTDTKDEEGGKDEKSEEPKGEEIKNKEEEEKDDKTNAAPTSDVDETEMMEKGKIEEQANEAKTMGGF